MAEEGADRSIRNSLVGPLRHTDRYPGSTGPGTPAHWNRYAKPSIVRARSMSLRVSPPESCVVRQI
jgi:hypothetical protein